MHAPREQVHSLHSGMPKLPFFDRADYHGLANRAS